MTDKKDTLLNDKNAEGETKQDKEVAKHTEANKEPPMTLSAIKTDLMQQYRNMAAISLVHPYHI